MRGKNIIFSALSTGVSVGLLYVTDTVKGLALIAGALVAGCVLTWPIVGLVCLIFSGTCLQIIGSSPLIGLPMSLGKIFGLLTLVGWGVHYWCERPGLTRTAQAIPLIAFLSTIVLSAIFEPLLMRGTGDVLLGLVGMSTMLPLYLLFFLVANLAGVSRNMLMTTLVAVCAATAATGLIGLLEYYIPALTVAEGQGAASTIGAVVDRFSIPGIEMRRVTGGVGDPNWLAYTAATVLPLNVYLWRRFHGSIARGLIVAGAGLQFVALVLSYTRSGFIGLAAAIVYLLWRRRIPVPPLAVLTVAGILAAPLWVPAGFIERMFSSRYLQEGSTPARRELLMDGISAFAEKPFWGHGYGQYGYYYMKQIEHRPRTEWSDEVVDSIKRGQETPENVGVHCLYLEVAVEYGLAGLIPFLLIPVLARKDLAAVEDMGGDSDSDLAICLTACILCYLVCGIFGHIKILKILWIVTGLAAALRRVAGSELESNRPPIPMVS